MMYDMKIGELSTRTGASTKTIRYYEDIGLLPQADRAANGYRTYDEDSVDRLLFIRDAQATGLPLTEIASILDLRGRGETTCHHVIDLLEHHLHDLDAHIKTLKRTRLRLIAMAERAKALDPSACTDPNRCQTIAHDDAPAGKTGARHLHRRPAAHTHGT